MKNASVIILVFFLLLSVSCSKENNKNEPLNNIDIVEEDDIQVLEEDNSLSRVQNAGKLVLGLDETFAPMGFVGDNGEIVGFDIDLAREVTKRMGVQLEAKSIDWAKSTSILTNGEIDVLWNGLNISDERKLHMNFSKPYLNNMLIIVKHNGDESINSIDDLAGKVVGVQYGGNYEQIANHPIVSQIKELRQYNGNIDALADLQNERLNAVIIDDVFAEYYIAQKNAPFTIVYSTPFTDGLYAVGIKKSDKKLLEEIDKILDEIKSDGTASNISVKWFGKDLIIK